jgi:DNA-directed RNA polymerase II subunit RPB1
MYTLDKLDETLPTLRITSAHEVCLFIRVLMRTYLSPKQVMKLGATKATLDDIYEVVVERFFESIAHPGEMVGIVAAQSIGEPTTQLTLNTFHLSGIESASRATRGLPRVKELLSVSKNPKQVVLTASLVPGFRETIDDANKVKNEIETTYLSQLVSRSSVYFDPEKFSTSIEEDKEIVEAYRLFDRVDSSRSSADVSPWVIRLEMSKPDLMEHGVTMFDVAEAINDFYRETVCCMYSDDNADQLIFRVRLTTMAAAGTSTDMLTDIRAFELSMLDSVLIKGGFGVSRAIPLKKHAAKDQCFDESVGEFVKCDSVEEEWVLETDGRDLSEIMAHPLVVSDTTISNDINEIWSVLGIEAARSALLHELGEVMREAYANIRHFYLLVDVMTHKGILTSIDRHGLNRGDSTSVLAKASFEETVDCLRSAAIFAEVDNVNSVAASIMTGQVVKAGTGGANVYLDETLIAELPEFEESKEAVAEIQDVSDDDLCRAIMKFMYVEPAQSTNKISRLETPRVVYV